MRKHIPFVNPKSHLTIAEVFSIKFSDTICSFSFVLIRSESIRSTTELQSEKQLHFIVKLSRTSQPVKNLFTSLLTGKKHEIVVSGNVTTRFMVRSMNEMELEMKR